MTVTIGRRESLAALSGAAAAWPLAARAAGGRACLLLSTQLDDRQVGAIRQGLKDAGYIEGRNVAIKYRSAEFIADRKVDVERLFTHRWRLEQAEQAYRLFDTQTTGKAVILPS